ncbi:hypothetical protein [Amycolatopsis solani]|uniref:hypothetical protein n=1 Tax=Amycolatopsis solani TaxID=3028615 RepID=UPI0025AFB9A5|nr:hypothetical protein [Amycolatopsis sp. MEP2-6]
MAWPPTLAELKDDKDIAAEDTTDDAALTRRLDAVVEFVERVRPRFNYTADPASTLPAPSADLVLGSLMLAARLYTRRRSPDGMVMMAELGAGRVPAFDPDIERLLGIGRHAKWVLG